MRISSNTIFDSNSSLLAQQQTRLLQTQQQIASGRRILTAADDPVAAARALEISQSDAMNTQYASNRTAARHKISMAESNLQSVTSLLHDVRTAIVSAGNGSFNNSDRRTIATELSGRLQELVGLANSTDGAGNYLFAGFQTKNPPFVDTAGGVGYFGDGGQQNMQVSATRQITSNDSGADVFMRVKNGNGAFVTQATTSNAGTGTIGLGAVSNSAALTGHSYTVAYTGSSAANAVTNTGTGVISSPTVADQAAVTGKDYNVTFSVAGPVTTYSVNEQTLAGSNTQTITSLDFTNPANVGTFVVDAAGDNVLVTLDSGAGAFADEAALVAKIQADLDGSAPGGYNVTSTGTVLGADFSVSIARTATGAGVTAVSVSAADAGALAVGMGNSAGVVGVVNGASVLTAQPYVSGQAISFGGLQFSIQGVPNDTDLFTVVSPGYTVVDDTTAAAILPLPPVMGKMPFTSGQTISFDGMRIDIQGAPADGDTFTVTPSVNESVFKTISDLITALNTQSGGASLTGSLNYGLSQMDNALNNILSVRSSLGLRLNEIDALQASGEDLSLQFKQNLSELQDVDYNKAISDLTLQQMSLQAAQKSFVQIADMSLFSYM